MIMRLTVFLVIISTFALSAKSYSQKVSLSLKDASLENAFNQIRQQTGYSFLWNEEALKGLPSINVSVRDLPIEKAIEICLNGLPLTFDIHGELIYIKRTAATSQNTISQVEPAAFPSHEVRGRVTDSLTGDPLVGVTIRVKGSTMGTTTGEDGQFGLNLSDDAILEFSYVGYNMKIVALNNRTSVHVSLSTSATGLNQLVVVGYGTQKKVDLTGAVSNVSGERLQDRPITNVSEGLQGVMANLNVTTNTAGGTPGSAASINIRGYTGLGASLSPLILVDGVPADINSINPQDIESITVLKDAAASAIYGSRAPYGVILIKTKEGKKGQPLTLSLNSNFSFSQPYDVPRMANSLDFVNLMNDAARNAGGGQLFSDDVIERIEKYMADPKNTPVTIRNPSDTTQWEDADGGNANNDWFNIYLKNWSPSEQHNISLNGGSDKITYFMGLGYNRKNGMFNFFHDSYKRYNFRTNINAYVNKWLTLSLKTSYAKEESTAPYAAHDIGYNWFHQIPRRRPIIPLKDPNGHYMLNSFVPEIMHGGRALDKANDSWITGEITLTPLEGWTIKGNYSYNYYTDIRTTTQLPYNYYLTNNEAVSNGTISQLWKSDNIHHYHTYNIFTSYERKLGNHYFKGLIGYQQEYKNQESLAGSNSNLYNIDQPSLSLTYGDNYNASDDLWAWATEGLFMRFNYNFKEKFLFEFNARYDGSSLFPEGHRYDFFPSFSAGYNVAKESFWPIKDKVSTFKLRASYGILGDVSSLLSGANYYPYQNTLSTSPPGNTTWEFADGREPYVQVGQLTAADITWAKPSMLDFGVDIGAFNERLQATFDWYRRKTTDLFGPAQAYPGVLGVSPPQMNNSSIQTKGFDLTLSWQDKIGKVGYNVRFILSNYKGTVLSYPNPNNVITDWYDGEPMGAIWGYTALGLYRSTDEIGESASQKKIYANWNPGDVHYQDRDNSGQIDWGNNTLSNPGDQSVIGNSTPQFSYGFNFGIDWKGFDLSGFVQGIGKRQFWTTSNYFWGIPYGGNAFQVSIFTNNLDRWTPETPGGYFPRYYLSSEMNKNMQPNTRYLLNAAYLRMKSLQLGYTLPEALTNRIHITRLRVYATAENLFTIAPGLNKKFQVDPELLISDSKIYPIQRTFSLGLNLNLQ
jgi:TonB-linked SusC/RagA family outer membrane protein